MPKKLFQSLLLLCFSVLLGLEIEANELSQIESGIAQEEMHASKELNDMNLQSEKRKYDKVEWEGEKEHISRIIAEEKLAHQEKVNMIILVALFLFLGLYIATIIFYNRLRKEKKKVDRLNEQKDDLVNVVAHDLLSPLSKVSALTQLLRNAETPEEEREFYKIIDVVIEDSATMIRDLLDIHTMENNNITIAKKDIQIQDLIEDSIIGLSERAGRKNIELKVNVEEDSAYIDTLHVKRILDNLVGNAIKFSEENTVVELTARKVNENLELEVCDKGPGFKVTDLENMYKKFSRLSAIPTGKESTNGLGLAIVKELVNRLDGEIRLKTKEGEGSTFTIILPT